MATARGAPASRIGSVSARSRECDRQAEHDLDQAPESATGVAECERQAGHDDDDHRDDL
jgi:hypothetical protein